MLSSSLISNQKKKKKRRRRFIIDAKKKKSGQNQAAIENDPLKVDPEVPERLNKYVVIIFVKYDRDKAARKRCSGCRQQG